MVPTRLGSVANGSFGSLALALVALMLGAPAKCLDAQAVGADGRAAHEVEAPAAEFLEQYCLDCHSGDAPEGGASLEPLTKVTPTSVTTGTPHRRLWRNVLRNVASGRMPPPDAEQPPDADRRRMVATIQEALSRVDCSTPSPPGSPTIRRLSRVEYRNSVRDLVGVDYEPATDFPGDDVGHGFDNLGDVRSVSPVLMDRYFRAGREIAERAIGFGSGEFDRAFLGVDLKRGENAAVDGNTVALFANGGVTAGITIPGKARLRIEIVATPEQAGKEWVRMGLLVDGELREEFLLDAPSGQGTTSACELDLPAGSHEMQVAFLNDYYQPDAESPEDRDRNLLIHSLKVFGPIGEDAEWSSEIRELFGVDDAGSGLPDARTIVQRVLRRFYRRPPTAEESARVLRWMQVQGGDRLAHRQLRDLLAAAFTSPSFLFRVESNAQPSTSGIRSLTSHEVATRLSYFLWSTTPSDPLLTLADQDGLSKPDQVRSVARQMLTRRKAVALVTQFADQWLQLRMLDGTVKDPARFPSFDDELRNSMRRETHLFVVSILREDRSLLDLIDADYTYVDGRLARLYGFAEPSASGFHRVSLQGTDRGGLLTQASILAVTSRSTRTSPVMRGKWVLDVILNDPPPPPEPGVVPLSDEPESQRELTLRQQLERHRADPQCAACHASMDALGFALEEYDAIGAHRRQDELERPLDTLGELPDGTRVAGVAELRRWLRERNADAFIRSVAERMFVYAVGRGVEEFDECALRAIVKEVRSKGDRFSALVEAIVVTDAFLKRGPTAANEDHGTPDATQ